MGEVAGSAAPPYQPGLNLQLMECALYRWPPASWPSRSYWAFLPAGLESPVPRRGLAVTRLLQTPGNWNIQSMRTQVAMFGAGGFIGSNLAHELMQAGSYELVLLDLSEEKLRIRLGDIPYNFVRCDIGKDLDIIDAAVADADLVVDLAAYVHPNSFLTTPLDVVRLNFFDTLNVVRACVKHRRRLMHFSTSEVYGKTGGNNAPFREDETNCILGPIVAQRWIYSNAKQLLDRIIHAHAVRGDLEYWILRPFNFVGPLMDYLLPDLDAGNPRVFAHFVSALMFGRPMRLVNGGHSRRCFTDIEDATIAIRTIMENLDATRNQIINIGNPHNETTIRDLARLMLEIYRREFDPNCSVDIVDVPGSEFYGPGYEDCDRRMPDISKLQAIGWSPKYGIDETFTRAMRFAVDNRERLLAELSMNR